MFAKKKRAPMPKGQGAAAAKQMGLFVDFNPEEMAMAMEENLDDPDLEAELAALTGSTAAAGGRAKPKGRSPMPMEDIARMADECMRDLDDEEEDENLEDDEDLLAELQEVVGDEEAQDAPAEAATPVSSPLLEMSPTETSESSSAPQQSSSTPGSLQHTLEERIAMYKAAIQSTKASGEASKARRYDRGLKTLETMLTAAKKGRSVNEAEIPPPVATGAPSAPSRPAVPPRPAPLLPTEATSDPEQQEAPVETETTDDVPEIFEPNIEEEQTSSASQLPVSSLPSPVEQEEEPTSPSHNSQAEEVSAGTRAMLLERQKEYKMAALSAKKQGEAEKAKLYLRTSKRFDAVIQALEQGQRIDLSGLPPSPTLGDTQSSASVMEPAATQPVPSPPAAASVPAPPRDVLEALEQRRAKYVEASAQAKASGDERKARMHDRIAKQYQSAIRSHKAGKSVNFTELPVPPGFPPIPGQDEAGAEQGFAAVLEAANQLANTDGTEVGDEDEEEEKEEESKPPVPDKPKKPMLAVPPTTSVQKRTPSPSPDRTTSKEGLSPTAIQQVEFLEGRRKQYMKAALQAKQKNDMDQAKQFLRTAKGFEPMIEAARSGKPVDISKVPSPPGDEDEEFVLVHHSEVQLSEKAEQVYTQLTKILKEQQEKCLTISKQFTHLGNIAETTKFEKLADRCKKSIEILRLSQARGLDPPTHHFEERTYNTVRIFPDLSSTEMVVMIVRGMNLPAPSGIQPNDLDAYVKFEFPYPSTEQPQKHKTAVIKNTNSPEYNQSFSLSINRNHRGFRRVVQNKGLKLEVLHKGGFLRSDKPVGTVHVKLDKLETQSEVREIVEVMDGRKATGGRVEVRVRLREPLSGQDLQTVTERWLVLDHSKVLL